MGRSRIGVCSDPADAALVRSAFDAHGIPVVIGAEQHAGLLGGLGASFLSMDIWVDSDDAEEAAALLADLRKAQPVDEADFPDDDEDDEDSDEDDGELSNKLAVRRGTGLAVMLALCITFGTGHMYTGAWRRGFGLAALEALGIYYLAHGAVIGGAIVGIAVFADLCGSLVRVRNARQQPQLPAARALK